MIVLIILGIIGLFAIRPLTHTILNAILRPHENPTNPGYPKFWEKDNQWDKDNKDEE